MTNPTRRVTYAKLNTNPSNLNCHRFKTSGLTGWQIQMQLCTSKIQKVKAAVAFILSVLIGLGLLTYSLQWFPA
ncbi:MAG: hypothetical protein ACI8WB_004190 [Phenylobacterium sp.]|jgi:hypothetical protein